MSHFELPSAPTGAYDSGMVAGVRSARLAAARHSTVAYKGAMAISGLIMVLYLLAHMYGNLKVFAGQAAFDGYAEHLRELGEPVLPHAAALWIIRVVLLASVLIHFYAAMVLWRRARHASDRSGGPRYQSTKNPRGVQRTYASFTLRWGGLLVALFIVYHLLNLTADYISPGGASSSPYQRTVNSFQIWWVVLSYTLPLLALLPWAFIFGTASGVHVPVSEPIRVWPVDGTSTRSIGICGIDHGGIPDSPLCNPLRVGGPMTALFTQGDRLHDAKVPAGPIEGRWDAHDFSSRTIGREPRPAIRVDRLRVCGDLDVDRGGRQEPGPVRRAVRRHRTLRHRDRRRRSDHPRRLADQRWGHPHTREKIVPATSDRFVIIADSTKPVPALHHPVPVELLEFGLASTLHRLDPVRLRDVPRSPDGGVIADCLGSLEDVEAAAAFLGTTAGLVEHGLFPPDLVSDIIVATGDRVDHRSLR